MSRKQRMRNRANAARLSNNAAVCERCGLRGKHFIVTQGITVFDMLEAENLALLTDTIVTLRPDGFWTCPDLYGPDGRRLAEPLQTQERDHGSFQQQQASAQESRQEG